jgi:hypothetical protein
MTCSQPPARSGKTEILLDDLIKFAEQIPDSLPEGRKILIVGNPLTITRLEEQFNLVKIIEELQSKNIEVVFHSTQSMSMGRVSGGEIHSLNVKYNHSYSDVIPEDIILKLKSNLNILHEADLASKSYHNINQTKTKLGINNKTVRVKSSRKGRGGQTGSNFHR